VKGQLALEGLPPGPEAEPPARTYWENRGPRQWEPVTVRVRYATPSTSPPGPVLPYVQCGGLAPRNVLVEREDGTCDVRPVRLLRRERPRFRS
jgi:hypothetical protein